MNDDYNDIEEKIKEKDAEEKSAGGRNKHKVSGKSVFEIQEILKKKSEEIESDEEKNK